VRSLAHILGSLANRRWRDRDLAHIYAAAWAIPSINYHGDNVPGR
jgi:hypothetical protein